MPMMFVHAQKVPLIFLEGVTQAVFQDEAAYFDSTCSNLILAITLEIISI